MSFFEFRDKAQFLVQRLVNESTQTCGTGSMSVAIYDTAWIAMISRDSPSGLEFLFPESFQYLLDAQSQEGGWEAYSTEVDGILNTAAALLALLKHRSADKGVDPYSFDLEFVLFQQCSLKYLGYAPCTLTDSLVFAHLA